MAIELQNVTLINRGAVVARCDVHIIPWKMILRDVTIFDKNGNRWPGMPSAKWTMNGQTKYKELVYWADTETKERFRDQFIKVWDEYVASNPMEPPKAVSEDEDVPF